AVGALKASRSWTWRSGTPDQLVDADDRVKAERRIDQPGLPVRAEKAAHLKLVIRRRRAIPLARNQALEQPVPVPRPMEVGLRRGQRGNALTRNRFGLEVQRAVHAGTAH